MKLPHKVVFLVALQTGLIISSLLIMIYLESQTNLSGNAVNVAGKNRLLASQVQVELNHFLFHDGQQKGQMQSLSDLERNIRFLELGGTVGDVRIEPLSTHSGLWEEILEKFGQYEDKVSALLRAGSPASPAAIEDIERTGSELISLFDLLAEMLARDVEDHAERIIAVQLILGTANAGTHVFVIWLILRIFRRHAEREIRSEKLATIGEFAALLAHDLKNPLGTITNSIDTIRRRDSNSDGASAPEYARIDRSVNRMAHQIYGVLNYARELPLVLKPHRTSEILERALYSVSIPKNISLRMPNNDTAIECDLEKMEFVFSNLLLNAVQAIGGGNGHIGVRVDDGQDSVTVEFENSGENIPRRDMQRIFEPLFTTKMQGTGLGLVSCKKIAERHGGGISVRNDPVTFTVTIPRRQM